MRTRPSSAGAGSSASSAIASTSQSRSIASRSRVAAVLVEAGQQAVRGEDGQARVAQRDEAHEHVAVPALAAALLGVDARGLVAVMAVGDQQLGRGERGPRGRDRVRVGDAPEPVGRAVVVGDLAVRRAA